MDTKAKRFVPFFAALTAFCVIFFLLIRTLPGIQSVEIDISSDQPDLLRVFYSHSGKFSGGAVSEPVLISEQRSKVKVLLTGSYAGFLRIDTTEQTGRVKIYQLKVVSYFHSPLLLGPNEIGQAFTAGPDASMQVFADHVQVIAKGKDPYLFGKTRLLLPMYWQSCLVALVVALLVGITMPRPRRQVADHLSPAEIPASLPPPERLNALDGLRGLAAMMVIADHTCPWFKGVGASGVWIFFALSGFLLARPFIINPQIVLSFADLSGYFRRRLIRILPMYYTLIFAVYVVSGRFSLAFMHGIFLEGDGYLWALPQEVLFYLLWPCVVFFLVLPLKRYPKITLVALLLAMVVWNLLVGREVIWLLGMDYIRLPLFFGVFLAGVFFSFLHSYCTNTARSASRLNEVARRCASPVGFAIILLFILLSTGNIIDQKIVYSQKFFSYYGFLAGLLVLCALYAKGRALDKFLTLAPLRELGTVALSLYLVHPLVKNAIDGILVSYFGGKLTNIPLFLATLGSSYILARYTFAHIEQPGFMGKKTN